MTHDEFIKIFEDEDMSGSLLPELEFDNALIGLNLIAKYMPGKGVEGADHDIIYSVDVDDLVDAGITKEDAEYLNKINWSIQEGYYLVCFV